MDFGVRGAVSDGGNLLDGWNMRICEGNVAKAIAVLLLLLGCSTPQRITERDGGLIAAKFTADHTMNTRLAGILRRYVRVGALRYGDTVMADDSVAMVFIDESGSVCWVRLKDTMRDYEQTIQTPSGKWMIEQKIRTDPDTGGAWRCKVFVCDTAEW